MKVKLKENVSAEVFGADKPYFDSHIKGKSLKVIESDLFFWIIMDELNEEWSVPKDSLLSDSQISLFEH